MKNNTDKNVCDTKACKCSLFWCLTIGAIVLFIIWVVVFFAHKWVIDIWSKEITWRMWIIISIVTLLAVWFVFSLIHRFKQPWYKHEMDYRTLFIIWICLFPVAISTNNNFFYILCIIYVVLWLANKDKWKKQKNLSEMWEREKKKMLILFLALWVLLLLGGWVYFNKIKNKQWKVANFQECIDAWNPAMESYPRQCMSKDGNSFTEVIWK